MTPGTMTPGTLTPGTMTPGTMVLDTDPQGYAVRSAGARDLTAVADCRRRWVAERTAEIDMADDPGFDARMAQWWAREADRRVTWLAWAGERPIGMASAVLFERMPAPGAATARWGYVSQVWVDAAYRRRGVATTLMGALIDWARREDLVRLILNPSDESRPMYAALGFREATDLLRLDLAGGVRKT